MTHATGNHGPSTHGPRQPALWQQQRPRPRSGIMIRDPMGMKSRVKSINKCVASLRLHLYSKYVHTRPRTLELLFYCFCFNSGYTIDYN